MEKKKNEIEMIHNPEVISKRSKIHSEEKNLVIVFKSKTYIGQRYAHHF